MGFTFSKISFRTRKADSPNIWRTPVNRKILRALLQFVKIAEEMIIFALLNISRTRDFRGRNNLDQLQNIFMSFIEVISRLSKLRENNIFLSLEVGCVGKGS